MLRDKLIDRPTARLIVLNERDQVLLLRLEGESETFWMPPGGGLKAGESYEQAARRELREETQASSSQSLALGCGKVPTSGIGARRPTA